MVRAAGGVEIPAGRAYDRADHQDLHLEGHGAGISDARFAGVLLKEFPDHLELVYGLLVNEVGLVADLEQRASERVALVVVAAEPFVERVK